MLGDKLNLSADILGTVLLYAYTKSILLLTLMRS